MDRQTHSVESLIHVLRAIVLPLLLCAIAAAQETTPVSALEVKYRKQIFKNDQVSIFLLEIPPNHASIMHRHDTDILSIFVAGGETRGTIYGNPPKEDVFTVGEVRFRPAGFTHSTENIGPNVFRSVILEFTSSMGPVQPAKPPDSRYCDPSSKTACVDEKYLFCTAKFCVKDLNFAPGAVWINKEYARDQVLIAVSDCQLAYGQQGKAKDLRKLKSGEIDYRSRGSAPQLSNVAGEPARIIAVVLQ